MANSLDEKVPYPLDVTV